MSRHHFDDVALVGAGLLAAWANLAHRIAVAVDLVGLVAPGAADQSERLVVGFVDGAAVIVGAFGGYAVVVVDDALGVVGAGDEQLQRAARVLQPLAWDAARDLAARLLVADPDLVPAVSC